MCIDDILASILDVVGCIAKQKRTVILWAWKGLDMEHFHNFGTVYESGLLNRKNDAESVFVYATKLHHATRESQRLLLIKVPHFGGSLIPHGKRHFWGSFLISWTCQTCLRSIFSTLFSRVQEQCCLWLPFYCNISSYTCTMYIHIHVLLSVEYCQFYDCSHSYKISSNK